MNKLLYLLCFYSVTHTVNGQTTFLQTNSYEESLKSIHYVFKIGNLTHPKPIIHDLYSVFNVNPLYKDSLGALYFDFYSKRYVTENNFSIFLSNKNYTLEYFKRSPDVTLVEGQIKKVK